MHRCKLTPALARAQVLVVRGNRKGIKAAQLRSAIEAGTLDALLPPVTQRSKPLKVALPAGAGNKRCGMCLNVRSRFGVKGRG